MALYRSSGVSIESWVELASDAPLDYELDGESGHATLVFGSRSEYVLCLQPAALRRLAHLATAAVAELDA